MKKKILALVMCVVMVVIILPVYAFAGYDETGNWLYSVTNEYKKQARLLKYYGDDVDVVVPAYIDGYRILSINSNSVFADNTNIKSVVLPETLVEIGGRTFQNCTSLEKVVVPSGVGSVGNRAFLNCVNLDLIIFENPDTHIAFDAFEGITSNHVEHCLVFSSRAKGAVSKFAGENGYYYFPMDNNYEVELARIYNPERYAVDQYIEGVSDFSCSYAVATKYTGSETDVKLSRDFGFVELVEIGRNAFEDCDFIQSVVLPYQINYIDEYAFKNCTALKSIALPETVISIDETAFNGCVSLETIYGLKNTYAEEFARTNNYGFVPVGDIDADGVITVSDYAAMESCVLGFNEINVDDYYMYDMNSDFCMDAFDLAQIDKALAG